MKSKLNITYLIKYPSENIRLEIKPIIKLVKFTRICLFQLSFLLLINQAFGYVIDDLGQGDQENDTKVDQQLEINYSDPSESLSLALEALEKSEYGGDSQEYAHAIYTVGLAYDHLGEDQLALKYFQQALKKFKILKDTLRIGKTLNNIGVVYDELGDYNVALAYYIKSLDVIKGFNDADSELTLYNNIGLIYAYNGLIDKSLNSLYKAHKIGVDNKLQKELTYPLHNLGDTYLKNGNYDSALFYFLQSYRVDMVHDDRQGVSINLQSMGEVCLIQGKYNEAQSHLDEALEIQTEIKDKYEQTNTLILLGTLYNGQKMFIKAKPYAEKALKFAQESKTKNQIKQASKVLSDVYKGLENYKAALYFTDLSNTYKDSIYNEFRSKQLVLLELNKKEVENAALQTDNEYKAAVLDDQQILIEKQTYAVIFVSLGLVLSFIAVSVLMNSNKDKNLANKRLLRQKEEIEKIIKELTTLNENINHQKNDLQQSNQVKDKLLSIISHDFRSPLNSLEGILDLLTQGRLSAEEMQVISKELRVKVNITTSLLDNLLNWAKSQMHGINTNPAYFDIKELVSDTIHLLSIQAEKKDIRIFNRVVDSQKVYSDYEMTKLIVRNLISNAIKFTTAGDKIFIKSSLERDFLRLTIKDTGSGMTEDVMRKLFTHEAKSTLGTAYEKGTGIGLILCKDFVEKNGGTLSVESEEGEGSSFTFTIPLSEFDSHQEILNNELSTKN